MTFKILISMVGDDANKERYVRALDDLGLLPHCEYCLHVESHEPVTEQVEPGVGERIYNRIEKELTRQWSPKPFECFFVNHEPKYERKIDQEWLRLRDGYTPADLEILREIGLAIGKHPLPGTMYNTPVQRPDMFDDAWRDIDDKRLADVATVCGPWDWVWHGIYGSKQGEDRNLTWFDTPRHARRAVEGFIRLQSLNKPIVPAIYLREEWDNLNWYGMYFALIWDLPFDRMVNWTDLRDDFKTGLYIDELRKVAPLLRELIKRKSREGDK